MRSGLCLPQKFEAFVGDRSARGNRADGIGGGWLRHLTSPAIGVPWLFNLAEGDDQRLGVCPLDVVAAIVKNVDHRVIIQPQNRPPVASKTMLEGDLDTGLQEDGFGLSGVS